MSLVEDLAKQLCALYGLCRWQDLHSLEDREVYAIEARLIVKFILAHPETIEQRKRESIDLFFSQLAFKSNDIIRHWYPHGCSSKGSEYERHECHVCTKFANQLRRSLEIFFEDYRAAEKKKEK